MHCRSLGLVEMAERARCAGLVEVSAVVVLAASSHYESLLGAADYSPKLDDLVSLELGAAVGMTEKEVAGTSEPVAAARTLVDAAVFVHHVDHVPAECLGQASAGIAGHSSARTVVLAAAVVAGTVAAATETAP